MATAPNSEQSTFFIGTLNCFRRSASIVELMDHSLTKGRWILNLNEIPLDFDETIKCYKNISVFKDKVKGRNAIITSMTGWKVLYTPDDAELIMVQSQQNDQKINLFGIYLRPGMAGPELRKILTALTIKIKQFNNANNIILGDVNCTSFNWGLSQDNKDNWTHRWHGEAKSWIDIIVVSHNFRFRNPTIYDINSSDHRLLYIEAFACPLIKINKINYKMLDLIVRNDNLEGLISDDCSPLNLELEAERLCNKMICAFKAANQERIYVS